MKRELLVNITPVLTRAALLEDSRVVELFLEHPVHRSIVGNIYKGEVHKIIPGISCAFVNIDQNRDGFLFVDDLVEDAESWEDLFESEDEERTKKERKDITGLLRTGQQIIVQVVRDSLPNKGPRVTSQIALAGKYLVSIPHSKILGVSKKIDNSEERYRLKEITRNLSQDLRSGLIVRTAAEGRSQSELEADAKYLKNLQDSIETRASSARVPSLIHRELPLSQRLIRDLTGSYLHRVVIDSKAEMQAVKEFIQLIPEQKPPEVVFHDDKKPIFEAYDIEKDISRAFQSKVWLKHGGYIIINQTEALVAIDVNSGKFLGKTGLEDTAYRTNLEAIGEIVKQIRLRNLGGIIVLDLIDMEKQKHRKAVYEALEKELQKDRAHSKLLNISPFGLVQMTRKRTKENLIAQMTMDCPNCSGSGRIKKTETVCMDIYNTFKKTVGATTVEVAVKAHPDVIKHFQDHWYPSLISEYTQNLNIHFRTDLTFHIEQFQIIAT